MADDPKAAIEALQAEQDELQAAHDKAQKSFHSARTKYAKAKEALVQFNTKYGRMLKLVVVDPDAEEEPKPAAPSAPATPAPEVEEVVDDQPPAVDISNEE